MELIRSTGTSLRSWLTAIVLAALVAMVALGAAQVLSGRYQVHPVLTGSMRPGFALGSVVVVKRVPASSVAVRDVILFHKPTNPSQFVVHRVISISERDGSRVFETKGDDNPVQDPWQLALRGTTAYRAQFTIPFVGYAALWLHRADTRRYMALGGAMLLLLMAGSIVFRRERSSGEADGSVVVEARSPGPRHALVGGADNGDA